MNNRYIKNLGSFLNQNNQNILLTKVITVIGCGGNGGYILEFLARLGVKKIIYFDNDNFELSNINRQVFCYENNLNKPKVNEAFKKLQLINSSIEYQMYNKFFDKNDINKITDTDIIFNAGLADVDGLIALKEFCHQNNVIFIDEFNNTLGSQITIVDKTNNDYFDIIINWRKRVNENTNIQEVSQPAYLCAMTASFAIQEMINYLFNLSYQNCISIYDAKNNFITRIPIEQVYNTAKEKQLI